MTAEARVFVDVESPVREWARDNVPSVGRRVFFGVNNQAPFPQVRVWRITGVDEAARFQFDVWADHLAQSAQIAAELATAAEQITGYTHAGVRLAGAVVESVRPNPDPESDKPRHIVDVTFTAYPA
jgi:hypothetical protein